MQLVTLTKREASDPSFAPRGSDPCGKLLLLGLVPHGHLIPGVLDLLVGVEVRLGEFDGLRQDPPFQFVESEDRAETAHLGVLLGLVECRSQQARELFPHLVPVSAAAAAETVLSPRRPERTRATVVELEEQAIRRLVVERVGTLRTLIREPELMPGGRIADEVSHPSSGAVELVVHEVRRLGYDHGALRFRRLHADGIDQVHIHPFTLDGSEDDVSHLVAYIVRGPIRSVPRFHQALHAEQRSDESKELVLRIATEHDELVGHDRRSAEERSEAHRDDANHGDDGDLSGTEGDVFHGRSPLSELTLLLL